MVALLSVHVLVEWSQRISDTVGPTMSAPTQCPFTQADESFTCENSTGRSGTVVIKPFCPTALAVSSPKITISLFIGASLYSMDNPSWRAVTRVTLGRRSRAGDAKRAGGPPFRGWFCSSRFETEGAPSLRFFQGRVRYCLCPADCIEPMARIICTLSPVRAIGESPFLRSARARDRFLVILEQTRRRYRFVVVGYVVMPVQLPHSSQNRA